MPKDTKRSLTTILTNDVPVLTLGIVVSSKVVLNGIHCCFDKNTRYGTREQSPTAPRKRPA